MVEMLRHCKTKVLNIQGQEGKLEFRTYQGYETEGGTTKYVVDD